MTKDNNKTKEDQTGEVVNLIDVAGFFIATIAGKTHTLRHPNEYHVREFEKTAMGQIVEKKSDTERTGSFTAAHLQLWKQCVESVGDLKGAKLHDRGKVDARCKQNVAKKMWDVTVLTPEEVTEEFTEDALIKPDSMPESVSEPLYLKVFNDGKYFLTAHVLNFPDDDDMLEFERTKTDAKTRRKKGKVITTPGSLFEPRLKLYDKLFCASRGYVKDNMPSVIPLIHKIEVMEYFVANNDIEVEETEGN